MVLPPYCRSRGGRVFRLLRSSDRLDADTIRYTLRAEPVRLGGPDHAPIQRSRDLDAGYVRDKIRHHQAVPTPEETFEQLWQQLRLDLDAD